MQAAPRTDHSVSVPFTATTMAGFTELSTDGPDFTGFRRKLGLGHQPVVVVAVLADTHSLYFPSPTEETDMSGTTAPRPVKEIREDLHMLDMKDRWDDLDRAKFDRLQAELLAAYAQAA